ncbi:MAG: PD-(D/E)XK nuclease family protein, partial [Clostridia bacterium]|nr:PD-(D/E)XK nuclease family protein [Clostridia bacterium]
SKGLQFPVCIVAGCGNGFNKTDLNKQIITNGKYGIGMSFVDGGVKYNTVAKNVLKSAYVSKMISEEIRLLYVAMTRAEERLMLSISCNDFENDVKNAIASLGLSAYDTNKIPAEIVLSAGGYKSMLLCSLLMQKDGDKLCEAAGMPILGFKNEGAFKLSVAQPNINVSNKACDDTPIVSHNFNPDIIIKLRERFEYEYPYKEACNTPSKMAVTRLVHGDSQQFAFNSRPRFMSKAGLTPAERGTALHKFMQFADFNLAEKDADAEVKRLYEFEFISEQEADSIDRNLLSKFFKSRLYNRIKNANRVWREYKFMVNYPFNGQKTIVQGIADCMFEENGKLVIVDFKTDNVKDINILSQRYSEQLAIYKVALSEILNLSVSECIIYSMTLSDEINV